MPKESTVEQRFRAKINKALGGSTRQGCGDCDHAEHVGPFKIWCKAGEGMQGDMYASGMLTNSRCVKNRATKGTDR